MTKRKSRWIPRGFKKQMVLFWMLQAAVVALTTYLITIGWTVSNTNPTLAGYINVFVRPALLISAVVGFVISCLAGLIYTHRIAGPVDSFENPADEAL
jgi:hypothetical protein